MREAPFNVENPSSYTPPVTTGHPIFDRQLDSFLDRFQNEIHYARELKDDLDHSTPDNTDYLVKKYNFKMKMQHIRALFETEGEDFLASLEKRNPNLTMGASGENTIELAEGIDRLETAMQEEESKRVALVGPYFPQLPSKPDLSVSSVSSSSALLSDTLQNTPQPASVKYTTVSPSHIGGVGHTLNNLTSDETLQLMQSDIHALKLELLRLQRSKVSDGSIAHPSPHSLPNRSIGPGSDPASGESPFSTSSLSPDKDHLPASILANHNVNIVRVKGRGTGVPPTYVSHLEQMKSRIEALEKKPLSRRARSVARLGRTQTMGSMYDSSSFMTGDENQNPNVSAMITPPRNIRRPSQRSLSTSSPFAPHHVTPPTGPLRRLSPLRIQRTIVSGSLQTNSVPMGISSTSPGSTPSPTKRPSFSQAEGAEKRLSAAGRKSVGVKPTSPAKLYFDAPEEMLSRPQTHAAAQDFRRYSLKVARRLVPSGSYDRVDDDDSVSSDATMQHVRPLRNGVSDEGIFEHPEPELRARSASIGAPLRRAMTQGELGAVPHTASEICGSGTNGLGNSPSSIDTTGSGGRVVEEIEGDMWVRKGVVWKRWRRRYASIVSHQYFGKVMCLFSYDSNGGVISTRSQIVVLHGSLCRSLKDGVEIGGTPRFAFQLRTSSKEYYFAAESDEIRRNWIKELRDAAQLDIARVVPKRSGGRSMTFRKR